MCTRVIFFYLLITNLFHLEPGMLLFIYKHITISMFTHIYQKKGNKTKNTLFFFFFGLVFDLYKCTILLLILIGTSIAQNK